MRSRRKIVRIVHRTIPHGFDRRRVALRALKVLALCGCTALALWLAFHS